MIKLKTKEEIEILREGGKILARILKSVSERVAPGVTTAELDEMAYDLIKEAGGEPAFLNYRPLGSELSYPASLCVSINDEVVHGIPKKRVIKEGDLVGLDLGLVYKGLITDHAVTLAAGEVEERLKLLLKSTEEALYRAIDRVKPGRRLGEIGEAVEALGKSRGFGVVTELSGHGVGYAVHEDPYVPNYGHKKEGPVLKEGMVLAIEPMFTTGSGEVKLESDGFTFTTRDGKPAAHFEHTVAVTEKGVEILTSL